MGTVFFTWELGGGFGHISQIVPLVNGLRTAGHRVFIALRDLPRAAGHMTSSDVVFLQAPYKPAVAIAAIVEPRTYAHVLWNAGFGDSAELQVLTDAWGNLFDFVKPDLIIIDHAPAAVLASLGQKGKRVLLDNGFYYPPHDMPARDLRPWMPPDPEQLQASEQHILGCMNHVLKCRHAESLERVSQLYAQVVDTFLTTFAEFDHYPNRVDVRYRGPWSLPGGEPPIWPEGNGKRIYAYLNRFPGLPKILSALKTIGLPTIIFGGLDPQTQERFAAPNLRFESRRLDIKQVAAECDVAILNSGHATTLEFLLTGKPILQAPIYLEQAINALNTANPGAGLIAFPQGIDRTAEQVAELLNSPKYADAARRFAAKYASFSAADEIAQAVDRLNELATASS